MTEFTLDLSVGGAPPHQPSDPFRGQLDQRLVAAAGVSPRNHRRNSADFKETANFLRACSLCKRRLIPGRDIYMYKYISTLSLYQSRHTYLLSSNFA